MTPLVLPPRVRDKLIVLGSGCWYWTAATEPRDGRPLVHWEGRARKAYRVTYEIVRGPIPGGLDLDHLCHSSAPCNEPCPHRRCVNPEHLEPVTRGENLRRESRKVTHCPAGHPYDAWNTRLIDDHRKCRACARIYMQNKRAALRVV